MRFVLVHGGFHGAWCWDKLIPELAQLGHDAVAPELPGHGQRRSEVANLDSYRQAVLDVLAPGDVLVGHSLGGAAVTLAAAAVPADVGHLVYLAAPVLMPGESVMDVLPVAATLDGVGYNEREFWISTLEAARTMLFHDCSSEAQGWAFENLTPQSLVPVVSPLEFQQSAVESVPRSYVACLDDRSGILPLVEGFVRRIGRTSADLLWSSHSPFISRPGDLAQLLVDVVEDGAQRDNRPTRSDGIHDAGEVFGRRPETLL